MRSKVILLIWVRNKSVVGSHHCHIKVDKISEERGTESLCVSNWKPWVDVGLNVPVCISIARLVILSTSDLNLLETPLWEVNIPSAEIAPKNLIPQSEGCGERTEF